MEQLTIVVDQQGNGDYATVAEAVQASPYDQDVLIKISGGVYREKVFCEKRRIHLMGAGSETTRLEWDDSGYRLHPDGRKMGTFRSYTLFLGGEDCKVSGLTIANTAGDGEQAGQALAVYADADRVWMEDVRLVGCQDTLFCGPLPDQVRLPNGFLGPRMLAPRRLSRQYYHRCQITGDIDFIFGGADAVFDDCMIRSRDRGKAVNGYITAPSGRKDGLGFVFRNCRMVSDAEPGTVYLGRPWRAYGKTTLIRCQLGKHIILSGWDDWDNVENHQTASFAEYGCTGEGAITEQRVPWCKVGDLAQAELITQRADSLITELKRTMK
ncbi:MAG: pectinesterase family protein [Eubacteriales bacterium]|nr:pectinesterase family protein [Eubacteriales bacterium]